MPAASRHLSAWERGVLGGPGTFNCLAVRLECTGIVIFKNTIDFLHSAFVKQRDPDTVGKDKFN